MKKWWSKTLIAVMVLALAAGMGSCSLFGIDGPTYLGIDWEGGTLYYDWDFPYPFNDEALWMPQTFYEVAPDTYYFQYDLPSYSFYSDWYYLNIEADSGSFPFGEGEETYFALLLMSTGPELYYGDRVAAAKIQEPDGSWTATASYGGKKAILRYDAQQSYVPNVDVLKQTKTK